MVSSFHLRRRLVGVSTLRVYGPADTDPSTIHDTYSENLQPSEILFTHAQPSTSRQRAVVAGEKARERWSGWSGAAWTHCGQQHGDYLLRRRRPSGMVHALAAVCEPVAQRESLCQGCRQNDGLRQHCMGRTACLPRKKPRGRSGAATRSRGRLLNIIIRQSRRCGRGVVALTVTPCWDELKLVGGGRAVTNLAMTSRLNLPATEIRGRAAWAARR